MSHVSPRLIGSLETTDEGSLSFNLRVNKVGHGNEVEIMLRYRNPGHSFPLGNVCHLREVQKESARNRMTIET